MSKTLLERYEQARTLNMGISTNTLIRNDVVFPHWISCDDQSDSHCFWYRKQTVEGVEYRMVDVNVASNAVAFDHSALAEALGCALDKNEFATPDEAIDPCDLPLRFVTITKESQDSSVQVQFKAFGKYWHFNPDSSTLEETSDPNADAGLLSPDGKKFAFIRDCNIFIRDQLSGEVKAVTEDGVADSLYGGYGSPHNLLWSADSQSLLFPHIDSRKIRTVSHVNYGPPNPYVKVDPENIDIHPQLSERKQAYPGDEHIVTQQLCVFHCASEGFRSIDYPSIPLMLCGGIEYTFFFSHLGWWSADSRRAFVIDTPRDSRTVRVVEWDTQSGDTRVVFEETDEFTVRLRHGVLDQPLIVPLPETDELIWFSERSGWGHLYLYDLNSGELKHQITGASGDGEWLVRNILHVDKDRRELLLQTAARDASISPYYRDICKVNIDTGAITPLLTGDFEHVVYLENDFLSDMYRRRLTMTHPNGVSPCGQYVVTTRSRADTAPVTMLIDRDGKEILTVESADTSSLPDDWEWPEPVKLKASDGVTDIYGVVFRPPGFSPDESYPVVDFISSMRSMDALPSSAFTNNIFCGFDYIGAAALATLGFVVVVISGRGTPNRHKSFFTHHYGDYAYSSDLTDRIAGLRQLAERYPYMDLDRVGLSANENPSNNAIYGALLHSDFYKVTVIHCMPDPRFWDPQVSESFELSMSPTAPPKTPYPEDCVDDFDGKLLLTLGMGNSAMHQATFLLVDALVKANKDFDLLCIPNAQHCVPNYSQRREWDYFVTHLKGGTPPKQFKLTRGIDTLIASYEV